MDDRRQTTISSEDAMIGEALMRVSETIEAERLTKSLDYQEKLRSRANIRLIIAIICLCVAVGALLIGGFLLSVLVKYEDPILDTVVPYLKSTLNGKNVRQMALTETMTYLPAVVGMGVRVLEDVVRIMDNISSIDLNVVINALAGLLGNASGMVSDMRGAIGLIAGATGSSIGQVGSSVANAITGLTTNGAVGAAQRGLVDVINNIDRQAIGQSVTESVQAIVGIPGEILKAITSVFGGTPPAV